MSTEWLIALTVFYFASGIVEAFIAKKIAEDKGHNGFVFFAVTCLSNVPGLLCACVIGNKSDENKSAGEITELKNRVAELERIISEGEERARATERAEREMAERAERERLAAEAALAAERKRAAELEEQNKKAMRERATSSYYDDGEASSLGWQVPQPEHKGNFAQQNAVKSGVKANSVLKDGRLVCSNCLKPIKFNDKVCRSCGAEIVPVDGSDGGFFRKK